MKKYVSPLIEKVLFEKSVLTSIEKRLKLDISTDTDIDLEGDE